MTEVILNGQTEGEGKIPEERKYCHQRRGEGGGGRIRK